MEAKFPELIPPDPRRASMSSMSSRSDASETLNGDDTDIPVGRLPGCDFHLVTGIIVARLGTRFDPAEADSQAEFRRFLQLPKAGATPATAGGTGTGGRASKIVVDFDGKPVTSAVLGFLLALQSQSKAAGGEVVICGLTDAGRDHFRVTRLDGKFRILPGRSDAIAAARG